MLFCKVIYTKIKKMSTVTFAVIDFLSVLLYNCSVTRGSYLKEVVNMCDSIDYRPTGEDYVATEKGEDPIWIGLSKLLYEIKAGFEKVLREDGAHRLPEDTEFEAHLTDLTGCPLRSYEDIPPTEVFGPFNEGFDKIGKTERCWVDFYDLSDSDEEETPMLQISRDDFTRNRWAINRLFIRLSRWNSIIEVLHKSAILSNTDAKKLMWK